MITGTVLIFLVNILTSVLKQWVYPRFGKIGVQVTVFLLALIGAAYYTYSRLFPDLETFVASAITIFSVAVAFYEVILSHLPLFKKGLKLGTTK